MDRISKFLRVLTRPLRDRVDEAMMQILAGDVQRLDVYPLVGWSGYFRCRVGNVRIVYRKYPGGRCGIVEVGFRKDVYRRVKRSA